MTSINDTRNQASSTARPRGVFWLTGLSSSGKTTLANECQNALLKNFIDVEVLDGDEIRKLFNTTGFTKIERLEHMKRVAEIACFLESKGRVVLVALISPYAAGRNHARSIMLNFHEIYLSASLEVCKSRDVKGLYRKALACEISNFTGISDVYEAPEKPELRLDTGVLSLNQSVKELTEYIIKHSRA
ncbi:MAG: adenylyl-sulfate kinase [Pseudobdellovibrio sp.]